MGNKTLAGLLFLGALALGGCGKSRDHIRDNRYDFSGKLGNEQVEFRRDFNNSPRIYNNINYLTVIREDGTPVIYIDTGNNTTVNQVHIGDKVYHKDAIGKEVLEIAQQQFDDYLEAILKFKKHTALKAVLKDTDEAKRIL